VYYFFLRGTEEVSVPRKEIHCFGFAKARPAFVVKCGTWNIAAQSLFAEHLDEKSDKATLRFKWYLKPVECQEESIRK